MWTPSSPPRSRHRCKTPPLHNIPGRRAPRVPTPAIFWPFLRQYAPVWLRRCLEPPRASGTQATPRHASWYHCRMPFAAPGTARKGSMVDNPFCELFPCLGRFCNNCLRPNAILRLATPRGMVRAPSVAPLWHTPQQGSGATGRARHIGPQKRPPRRQTVAGLHPSGARSQSGA